MRGIGEDLVISTKKTGIYKDGTRFSRPVRKYWGGIRYFDLYGYVALAYDVGREVLDVYKRQGYSYHERQGYAGAVSDGIGAGS